MALTVGALLRRLPVVGTRDPLAARLDRYVRPRARFWCSPYCALSFGSEAWRTRHRAVCDGFARFAFERTHHVPRREGRRMRLEG